MVDVSNQDDFPALVKSIKGGMELSDSKVGSMITDMRKTKNCGLLLEMRGVGVAVEAIKAEVTGAVWQDTNNIRLLQQKMLLVPDIDEWSTKRI